MDRLMAGDAERERLAACAPGIVERFGVNRVMAQWLGVADETIRESNNRGRPAWGAAAMHSTTMQRLDATTANENRAQDRPAKGTSARCRVLFVIRALTCGGAERQLIELVRGIDKQRFLVTVATFYDGGAFDAEMRAIEETRVVGLQKKGRWDIARFLARFVRLVREVRPDVVHGYMGIANELTLLARVVSGARAVWGIRGSACDYTGYNDWGRGFSDWVGMKLSRFADCIIVNSEAGRAEHVADGYEGRRMKVIHNGIDTMRFCPDPEAGSRVRREWGVPPAVPLIGIVARLDPMKGHSIFLRAAALMGRRRPEVRFVCVGDGPEPYKARLHAEAVELELGSRLEWRGALNNVTAAYNALTILTSSSLFGEGFSNVIGEAMACGTPVVATDVGDAALIVNDPRRVVAPGCPEKLVEAWEEVLNEEPAALDRHAKQGRERIIGEYGMTQLVSRTEAALLETLPCRR
jgi:glycosyltransferase involved in cell wall biosynthesis